MKNLPNMSHVFTVKIKGEETQKQFEGTFKYQRPNLKVDSEIDKTRALLDGGIKGLGEDIRDLHRILATLRHTIVEYPDWWEDCDFGYELYDLNVVLDIYMETKKFEADFENKLHGEDKATKGDERTDKPEETGEDKQESAN
ncbi:MAG: hypothetical protein GWN01_15355 [Nitrosopumilaceae archaeon]|nr:hypothetical protein [Nitrosopumilaceae archaeon]NIU87503.1 hypothetical protein [Nitrosopumilaceae archaeon]NIX62820.1 hypothetical protein [Nitrosopumilaceae archaeon]